MESFTGFVSQHIPWFWGVLAWSLAILGLIVIAAIPAYFLLYPITTNVRRGVASYLSRLVSRQSAARERRRRAVEGLIEDFKDNAGITYVSERLTRVEAALASFSEITKKLKPQLSRVSRSEEHTSELQSHVNLVCRLVLEKKTAPMLELIRRTAGM